MQSHRRNLEQDKIQHETNRVNKKTTVKTTSHAKSIIQRSNTEKDQSQETKKVMKVILMKSLLKVWRRSSLKTVIFNQNENFNVLDHFQMIFC